jgi:predicted MFS family arabinose efflux permease
MTSGYRWVVLGLFALVAAMSQMLWLNYAPLVTLVQSKWGVGEGLASLLLLVFPLVYVFLSVPAGKLVDRVGYRKVLSGAAVLMAAFSAVRIYDGSFWVTLAAQVAIAAGQPFAINAISKLVTDWFDAGQSALATGLGTLGMYVGMAAGMAATPPLVEALGYQGAMAVFAASSAAIAAAWVLFARANPAAKPATAVEDPAMLPLLKDRSLVVLFALAFLGMGFFNGLTAWLEPILAPHGFDAVKAGAVGGVLIGGGILGCVALPALSDKLKMRKPVLIASVILALGALVPTCRSHQESVVMAAAAAVGFFFLPAFALLLDMCGQVAGDRAAGSATGLLMLFGNGGAVVVIEAMQWVKGDAPTFERSVTLLYGLVAVAIALAFLAPETFRRSAPATARAAAT